MPPRLFHFSCDPAIELFVPRAVRTPAKRPPGDDAGMWVSRSAVGPLACNAIANLPQALLAADVELRALPDLTPLREVWRTTLHASGLRLRNAVNWNE